MRIQTNIYRHICETLGPAQSIFHLVVPISVSIFHFIGLLLGLFLCEFYLFAVLHSVLQLHWNPG